MNFKSLCVASALVLAGCGPEPTMVMQKVQADPIETPPVQRVNRISVSRVGVFKDDLAYHEKRGVYIITDSKTGKEYIGVSGVGITETGIHGKDNAQDER